MSGLATNPADALRGAVDRLRALSATSSFSSAGLGRAASGAFLIRVASAAIAFLSQPLLARWMGSDEFGIFAYVWTWALLISGMTDFGLSIAAQRFIPEYHERSSFALLRGFLAGSRWFTFAAATVGALLAAAAVKVFEEHLAPNVVLPMYVACGTLPFWGVAITQDGIARSYGWIGVALLPLYIIRPLGILALIFVAYLCGFPATALSIMLASVVASVATAAVQGMVVNRRLHTIVTAGPRAYDFKTWIGASLPISIATAFYYFLSYVDVLVLQVYRPSSDVAIYFAVQKLLALVAFVHFSIAATAAYRFSELRAAGRNEELAQFYARSRRWTFWPSLAGVGFLLAFGWPLLWLFGPEFVSGYGLIGILSIGLLARAVIGPAERLLIMFGQQKICALVYTVAFVSNLAGCILLVPRFGLEGAAASTAAALVLESAVLFLLSRRQLAAPSRA
ncbi:MAG: lipopolysaccharide biosynthesis protein [Variibacter sp.]